MATPRFKDRPCSPVKAEQPLHKSRVKATQSIHSDTRKSFASCIKIREQFPTSPARQDFQRKSRSDTTRPVYDMKYHPMGEVLRPNAPATAKALSQRPFLFCDPTDPTPLKDCKHDGLDPSGERKSAPPFRTSSPTLAKRTEAQVGRRLGSDTSYYFTDIGSQFN